MEPDQRPFSEYSEPVPVREDEPSTQAAGVIVGVMVDPETLSPGILFQFVDDWQQPTASVFLRGRQPMLPNIVTDAVAYVDRLCKDPDALVTLITQMLRAADDPATTVYENAVEMTQARSTVATCPGCGRQIYGDIAARGGCLACYPELPPGGTPIS